MRRAVFVSLLALAAVGCSSHGSSTVLGTGNVSPRIVQGGSQSGWVSFPLPYNDGIGLMVNGSDGNVWTVAEFGVVRIDMNGSTEEFNDPSGGQIIPQDWPFGAPITSNPDGNIYATDALQNGAYAIAQVTPQGVYTDYALPSGNIPIWLTSGSDGNVWMIRSGSGVVAKISPQGGGYTEYSSPWFNSLTFLTSGPDKNLWGLDGALLVRISVADGTTTLFTNYDKATSLVAMPDGGLWEASCHTHLTRYDVNGNAQQFALTYKGKMATACYLAAGPANQLYWAGQTHLFGFNVFTHTTQRYAAIPIPYGSTRGTLIGPDQNFWTKVCCYNDVFRLDVYLLHLVVATPSSISVMVGSRQDLSVAEKRGPNQTFTAVSNNPAVATVSGSAHSFIVTGVSSGSTAITVSDSIGNSLDVPVTVQ